MRLYKIAFPLIVLFTLLSNASFAQIPTVCPTSGQNDSSAFPVCGSSVFIQDSVAPCGNFPVPVRPCLGDGYVYTDINPYWYKFKCFKTGTLSLLITPNVLTDDYDWQLFDITGHNFADVYTDSSLIVACNWSGNAGVTGANSSGTNVFNCGGFGYPNIGAMPTIIQGHNYVLMVSHFTKTNQSGYSLTFGTGGGTAVITDTLTPKFSSAALKCSGSAIGIKLDKPMLCKTLATDGSGFALSSSTKIDSAVGHGCKNGGFDMDSITVYLAAALDTGRYILSTKLDSSGGGITDICNTPIPIGDSFGLYRVIALPTKLDSITTPLPCAPQQLQLVFDRPMLCDSVAPDGSQFAITGPSPVTISSATTICDSNGLTRVVFVNLASTITIGGTYKLTLRDGVNFTTLVNECSVPTPTGEYVNFNVANKLTAAFSAQVKYGCKNDTLSTVFNGVGKDSTTNWKWYLGDTLISTADSGFVYDTLNPGKVKLIVGNGVCSDSYTETFPPVDHTINVGFTVADTICSNVQASFTDTSSGSISSWRWIFGNGDTSLLPNPALQTYPTIDSNVSYQASLVAVNQVGCKDSTSHPITVISSKVAIVDSIKIDTCGTQSVHFFFNKSVQCSSVDSSGSNFTLVKFDKLKQDTIPIVNAKVLSCLNNLGNEVAINLNSYVSGDFLLSIHADSIGNRIMNECNLVVADTNLLFTTPFTVAADFYDSIRVACKTDTLFAFDSCKAATNWLWVFESDTLLKSTSAPVFVFTGTNPKTLYLKAFNAYCSAANTFTIIPLPHSLTTAFDVQDTTCPLQVAFTNNSVGKVIAWQWNFGNGDTSKQQTPPAINYPSIYTFKKYTVSLIARDSFGCIDTVYKTITIKPGAPALIDTLLPLPCAPKMMELTFNNQYLCSSLAIDGSNFSITGPSVVVIDSAASICNGGLGDSLRLFFASPIVVSGEYSVKIKTASDGSKLTNGCNTASPIGNALKFKALDAVDAHFDPIVQYGCKIDTITYSHNNLNGIDKWDWTFFNTNDTFYFHKQDTSIVYTDFSPKKVQLFVSNEICNDTYDTIITLKNYTDTIKPGFTIQKHDDGTIQPAAFVCPIEEAIFTDTSIGKINKWHWDFGDNQSSTAQDPEPQLYPHNDTIVNYLVRLIITGDFCTDTANDYIKVIPNCYIDVPTAFTPNGDGKNDYLYPLNAWKADNLLFRVFNRFGQLVFETRDWTNKWDGTVNGSAPIVGTYVWMLDYIDHDTQLPVHKKGTTVLIR